MKVLNRIRSFYYFYLSKEIRLYKYKDFNEYKDIQIEANLRKQNQTWATEESLAYISKTLTKKIPAIRRGLCHGVRNGTEIKLFKRFLGNNIYILGTEISFTAKKYPNVIQWDFHNLKKQWVGKFDFVYSNALDHAYNPELCIRNWISCLEPKGLCVIEWSRNNAENNPTDPFGASLRGLKSLIKKSARIESVSSFHDGNIKRFLFFLCKK